MSGEDNVWRKDFPVFDRRVNGRRLAYLDSGASAQKPRQVLDAMRDFTENEYANIHRGAYELSMRATERYEQAREKTGKFINAKSAEEIIFTKGATESINMVAATWGRKFLKEGDEVVITELEHHANIVPWQLLRGQTGIEIKTVPITKNGEILPNDVKSKISPRTKLVSVAHVSNALGTILPVKEIGKIAHENGAVFLVDGCQAISHMPVDVQDIDADFYAFSGHKLYGPTGIGVLYGKREILKSMPPYQGGGDMIASVSFKETTFREPPHRFEAGTPPIIQAIGLGAAIDYVASIGMENIFRHEAILLKYATEKLEAIEGLKILGKAREKSGIISFVMEGIHPHDVGTVLDSCGVAVRAGHHCAQPLMEILGVPATVRASFGIYNSEEDIDALVSGIKKAREMFS